LADSKVDFQSQFNSAFKPNSPFQDPKYTDFSQSLLSNLQGGIGYFYGNSKVDTSNQSAYREDVPGFWKETEKARARAQVELTGPNELFTAVPSRAFFPRGFLWDEGFHLLVIMDWDIDLALEIMQSWLALMDENGWIAREQILGPEARSKVPLEFQTQYPHYANPPTMFLAFEAFLDHLDGKVVYQGAKSKYLKDSKGAKELVTQVYQKLKTHYSWFRQSQKGNMSILDFSEQGWAAGDLEGYRWRGRTPEHTLTSGLDDYPRADTPHPNELHVDATSWVGVMARVLHRIAATHVKDPKEADLFAKHLRNIKASINQLHWSDSQEYKAYYDFTGEDGYSHIRHKGYVSLMPFFIDPLDTNPPHLSSILDLITDRHHLWTDYGIRSLSALDPKNGQGENYWRGPIWININYLILVRLLSLANTDETARQTFISLRKNIVNSVYKSWHKTGFAWEQYSENSGDGQRTQGFTGWTALVIKIMCMPDLEQVSSAKVQDVPHFWAGQIKEHTGINSIISFPGLIIFMIVVGTAVVGRKRIMAVARTALGRWI
jgi:mannosyl-oligosaccharide glucosidase